MYALRIAYQRHRKLLPHIGAGVALFFATLLITMPMPAALPDAAPAPASELQPAVVTKAGALSPLLVSHPMEEQARFAFAPAQGPL